MESRIVQLTNEKEVAEVAAFLRAFDLSFDGDVDYTVAFWESGRMVATGSFKGEVIRNVAVDASLQGEGLLAAVTTELMQEQGRRGIFHRLLFTRPGKAHLFAALGFVELAKAEPYAALLEQGLGGFDAFCRSVANALAGLPAGRRAALVMNCNPFTLGHQALVAKAAAENDSVVLFAVKEDRSLFPFDVRLELVKQGVAQFKNVRVVSGGDYIISAATFPGYFTREENLVAAQTRLDAALFAARIAPALGITRRYVGEEPYCPVTNAYNEALTEILPQYGVTFTVIPRVSAAAGDNAISASSVREALRHDDWATVRRLVPDTTWDYLQSPAALPVLQRIRETQSRH